LSITHASTPTANKVPLASGEASSLDLHGGNMKDKLNRLKEIMSSNYDWDKHWDGIENGTIEDISLDDLFGECFAVLVMGENTKDLKGYRCVGFDIEDTPKALYRALYLGKPNKVDFSDMYKTGMLFGFRSPCGNFFATIELFKYEFGVYFYCKNKEDIGGQAHGVQGGWPSCDNGIYCKNPSGQLWFDVLKMALEYEHDVYSGNNFKV
jgi:hypothetical protein